MNGIRTNAGVATNFVVTGETTIQVTVISVLGPSKTYTINANIILSSDATLQSVNFNNPTIAVAFASTTYNYLSLEVASIYRSIGCAQHTTPPPHRHRNFVAVAWPLIPLSCLLCRCSVVLWCARAVWRRFRALARRWCVS